MNRKKIKKAGRLFVVSGPSGAGKSSLIEDALKKLDGFSKSISVTTRPKRVKLIDHSRYRFLTKDEFETMIEQDKLLEWAEYSGYLYGTPKEFVLENLKTGENVILEIEVKGAMQVKEKLKDAFFIFITTTDMEELQRRLLKRGTESLDDIKDRIKIAAQEIKYQKYYNCIIVNNNYNEALQNLIVVLDENKGGSKN